MEIRGIEQKFFEFVTEILAYRYILHISYDLTCYEKVQYYSKQTVSGHLFDNN